LTEEQKQKAVVALRKIQTEKDIKVFKLHEYYKCQRLALLLRIPFSIIKQHVAVRASVGENGLLKLELSQEIPINKYLQRDSKDTFEKWLEVNYPGEFAKLTADRFTYLFGYGATTLTYRDEVQKLVDEFDRFCWCRSEEERRFYFSSLLANCDIDGLDEFALFGSVNPPHSAEEISDFKAELKSMQADYLRNPDAFFHPSDDLIADAAASGGGSDSILSGSAPPGTVSQGEGARSDIEVAEIE
jgi:hypothetical protein